MTKSLKFFLFGILALLLVCVGLWQIPAIQKAVYPLRINEIKFFNIPENRLRFKVAVDVNKKSNFFIKYWQPGKKDTLFTEASAHSTSDTLYINNTLAKTDYKFQVVAQNGIEMVESRIYGFSPKSIYQATPYFELNYQDSSINKSLKNKFFLTQILTEPGSMVIIDSQGNIVWYQPFKKGVKVSHWTSRNTVLAILGSESIPSSGGDEIVEVDLKGKVIRSLKVGKGEMDKSVHHEVRSDENENIYAITFDKKIFDLSSVGGLKKDTVKADGIVMFDKENKKIWEWSVLDHLNPLEDALILKRKKDWVHANAVFRDKEGNFLLSYRDLNQIWKIQYPSGKVMWKFGEKGDFPLQEKELFSSQHGIHTTKSGDFLLLDNGTKKGFTSAKAFTINETQKTAKLAIHVKLDKAYYSTVKGNVSMFGNDKLLFCLTEPRTFLITDLKGKILWDMKVGGDPYRLEEIDGFRKTTRPIIHD